MANKRFADLANMKSLFAGLKSKYAGKGEAVKSVTRAGTTFTATMADGTTFSFDQQDTTYPDATQSAHGLMSAADKAKLDGVQQGADSVAVTQVLSSGTKVATITVNDSPTDIYCQQGGSVSYSTETVSGETLLVMEYELGE